MKRTLSQAYLILVPFIGTILAFQIGYVSYQIYLPIWLLNVTLMSIASWFLGLRVITLENKEDRRTAMSAFFLIIPFILISLFAGLGPPPETAQGWVETTTEQQIRYFMLVMAGIFIALGFITLKDNLKGRGEDLFSVISVAFIAIAIPLFTINMLYWGFFLPELFKIKVESLNAGLPEWFLPTRRLFGVISATEVALTFLAISSLALSLYLTGYFRRLPSIIYVFIGILAAAAMVLSLFLPGPLETVGFALSIPASPFLMPYFIGINLLRHVGNKKS